MAKKILYKVTAYHCPRCGGITEPTRKYCEYCERDLAIRSKNQNRVRLLIDCGNYVFFDSIKKIDFTSTPQIIDTTMLGDCRQHYIKGLYDNKFKVDMMATARTAELFQLEYTGLHKIRLECLDIDMAYEQESYRIFLLQASISRLCHNPYLHTYQAFSRLFQVRN